MKSSAKKITKEIEKIADNTSKSVVIIGELFLGLFMCIFSLFIFIFLTSEMLETDFNSFDIALSHSIYNLRTPALTNVMIIITDLTYQTPLILFSLISIILLIKKHTKEAVLFCIIMIMGILLNLFLKEMIQRPRPTIAPLVSELSYSFPSGHAMNSFIFFTVLAYFSYHFFKNKLLTIISTFFAIFLILLIGFSRVYLGVHYPTDIIAGYIAGFWWFVTVLLIDRTLIYYKIFKKSE